MPGLSAMERALAFIKTNWKDGKTLKEVADP